MYATLGTCGKQRIDIVMQRFGRVVWVRGLGTLTGRIVAGSTGVWGWNEYAWAMFRSLIAHAIAVVVVLTSGCLSQTHTIPRQDLFALAHVTPEERGRRVRVIQNTGVADEPPEAPRVYGGNTIVVVPSPIRPVGPPRAANISAKLKADEAAALVVIAAAAAVGLAVTEGMRYDGWVELHPMHPVHLFGYGGQYTWVPLAQLTPELAAWSRTAMVRPSEGPWQPQGRAPLNRKGLTYAVLLGTSEVLLADGSETRGFMSHIQFGGFMARQLGVLIDVGLGWAEDRDGNTVFDSRNGLELQFLPIALGRLHGGVFGQVGFGRRFDDSPEGDDQFGLLTSGGAVLQLELTTRLAITARGGVTQVHGETTSDVTFGLSIY